MTRAEAHALLLRHQKALNLHDVRALGALYAEDAVLISPMFTTVRGRAAIERSFHDLFDVFPDYHVSLTDALFIYEAPRAAEFSKATATHSTDLFGLSPTGHQIEYQAVRLFTFRGDLIAEERRVYDFGGVLERLEKARVDRELAMAADIQRLLLPRTHHVRSDCEVVGASLPCRAIGGDFFEYVDWPSGAFSMALGDVSGKGPAAALVGTLLQGMLAMQPATGQDPSVALSLMNQALLRRGIEPRFATMMYGVLSPGRVFRYANAGHNPALLLTDEGIRRLSAGGPMLGVFDAAAFPSETIAVRPGDTLVAYSDGAVEASNARGEPFGEERLASCVVAGSSSTPSTFLDALFGAVQEFCGDVLQGDDVTITVTRFR